MKPVRHVVTDEEFAQFEQYVREFVDRAGLNEWEIYVERGKHRYYDGWVRFYFAQKKAFIVLNHTVAENETIRYIAAHEVAEVMLGQLDSMAQRMYSADVVDEYRHEVINHIVRLFLEKESV